MTNISKDSYLIKTEIHDEEKEILNLIKSSALLMGLEFSKNRFIKSDLNKSEENEVDFKNQNYQNSQNYNSHKNDRTKVTQNDNLGYKIKVSNNRDDMFVSRSIAEWKIPAGYLKIPKEKLEYYRKIFQLNVENIGNLNIPPLIDSFESMKLPEPLIKGLHDIKIYHPTAMQMQGIPAVLLGRDLIGIASTGTGKSLVFILPSLILSLYEEYRYPLKFNEGPFTIIIVPSRELAVQLHELFNHFLKFFWQDYFFSRNNNSKDIESSKFNENKPNLKSVLCIGGVDIKYQIEEISRGCHLIIGTPGRLSDLMEKKKIDTSMLRLLVLDEADRLMDMGFDEEIKKVLEKLSMGMDREQFLLKNKHIHKNEEDTNFLYPPNTDTSEKIINPSSQLTKNNENKPIINDSDPPVKIKYYQPYQTLIFSSTMPKKIQQFAKTCLLNPVVINVGPAGAVNSNVVQEVEYVKEECKLIQLLDTIQKTAPPVLIFCENKNDVDEIHEYLLLKGLDVCSMHGDIKQEDRNEAVREFREGLKDIMVATDIVSKGLDFPDIEHVINYDMPKEIENYLLRIGRTGRLGKFGLATTYVNRSLDEATLFDLKHLLLESDQTIPPFLMSLPEEENNSLKKLECPYCGLSHKLSQCHKFENQRMKSLLSKQVPNINFKVKSPQKE
jgi:ATP-dependent RNA helicase DDX41